MRLPTEWRDVSWPRALNGNVAFSAEFKSRMINFPPVSVGRLIRNTSQGHSAPVYLSGGVNLNGSHPAWSDEPGKGTPYDLRWPPGLTDWSALFQLAASRSRTIQLGAGGIGRSRGVVDISSAGARAFENSCNGNLSWERKPGSEARSQLGVFTITR